MRSRFGRFRGGWQKCGCWPTASRPSFARSNRRASSPSKLAKQILAATTTKRLEDLYLPYKPKKQTLATLARSRGLEQLAREILEASPACADLDARAADFVNPDRQVPTAADALLGAGHILAEQFSEQAELRQRLREVLQRTGVLVSSRVPVETKPAVVNKPKPAADVAPAAEPAVSTVEIAAETVAAPAESVAETNPDPAPESSPFAAEPPLETAQNAGSAMRTTDSATDNDTVRTADPADSAKTPPVADAPTDAGNPVAPQPAVEVVSPDSHPAEAAAADAAPVAPPPQPSRAAAQRKLARQQAKQALQKKRELKKQKVEEKKIKAFRDYFDYREEVKRIPPHRVLAINRGERARVLRVKLESDLQAMVDVLDEMLVPPGHPHADYLRGCARDALSRLILPSLERDVRRELTDRAELHAVGVFAKNLRNLLLQPPVHNHRILAVDPGFKSGCKLAALDQFGNLLGHGVIYLVGKPDRRDEARQKVLDTDPAASTHRGGHRQRHRLPPRRRFLRRADRKGPEGPGRGLRDRQRGRRQRLLHQPHWAARSCPSATPRSAARSPSAGACRTR